MAGYYFYAADPQLLFPLKGGSNGAVVKQSRVLPVSHAGGDVHDPDDIYKVIKEAVKWVRFQSIH